MSRLCRLPFTISITTSLLRTIITTLTRPTHRPITTIGTKRDVTNHPDVCRSNFLIAQLCRERRLTDAQKVFDEMPERDVITWTSMVSGYVKCGMLKEARRLFEREDSVKNVVTWTTMVSGYVRSGEMVEAERLFEMMPTRNVVSWNTMIDGYVRNGRVAAALRLFEVMPERNVVSWNTVVAALARSGRVGEGKRLFDVMPERDVISWTAMVDGLAKNGRIDEARGLFDGMPERNTVSWNAMITGYSQNSRMDEALDLFERMPQRNAASWNTILTGFIQNGDVVRARKLFDEMPHKNVISWSAMVDGYVQDGESEVALQIFFDMQMANSVKPNQGTFVSVLAACSNLAGLTEGKQIHQIICKTSYQHHAFVVSALVNLYSKCGELVTARKVFDDYPSSHKDLVSWNGIIAAYAHHGCADQAIKLFEEMRLVGFRPNDATYVALLSACSHSGSLDKGLKYFEELVTDKTLTLREDHYACLVDLCGRAGRLNEAIKFIERLGKKPLSCVWGALLAGCSVQGNVDVGILAAEKLFKLEPDNEGTYMLLANTYASTGKWREAAKVRLKMKEKGLKKQPGCSWIEVGNRFHVFVVGDKSHNESRIVRSVLRDLHVLLKKAGFAADHDFVSQDELLVMWSNCQTER